MNIEEVKEIFEREDVKEKYGFSIDYYREDDKLSISRVVGETVVAINFAQINNWIRVYLATSQVLITQDVAGIDIRESEIRILSGTKYVQDDLVLLPMRKTK